MPNWENPPWMLGGGVEHSVEVARLLAFAAFGGEEGVIGSKDLLVTQTTVPSMTVNVNPGACAILNRHASGLYQGYAARLLAVDPVPIASPGAGTRYDLIVARIYNPYQSEGGVPAVGPTPGERQAYEYVRSAVLPAVASTRTVTSLGGGYSAIPLALVTVDPGATSIGQAKIRDLRNMVSFRRKDEQITVSPAAERVLSSAHPTYANWPSDLNMSVDVPEWATHFDARAIIGGAKFGDTTTTPPGGWNVQGYLRVILGTVNGEATTYNLSNEGGIDRTTLMAGAAKVAIPTSIRGTTVTARLQGSKNSGNTLVKADESSMCALDLSFYQERESTL